MKSAEEIVLEELNKDESGSHRVLRSIGISRVFEEPIITDDMTEDQKAAAFLSAKPVASEEDIAAEVLRVYRSIASKTPEQLRTEQLTYVYKNIRKAFDAVNFDRLGAFRNPPVIENQAQLEERLMKAWGYLESAMLILGNYVDRDSE